MSAKAWRLLKQVLRAAAKEHLLFHPIEDPVPHAGRENPRERHLLTENQVLQIVAEIPPNRRILPIIAATCGTRFGEVAALRRMDIDVEACALRIYEAVTEDRQTNKRVRSAPKTRASVRSISVHPQVMELIVQHLETHVSDESQEALLLPTRTGRPLGNGNWNKQWRRAVEAAGLNSIRPGITTHDLRHHCLTMAAARSRSSREVMAFAGHATEQAALRYQHLASQNLDHLARPFPSIESTESPEPPDPPTPAPLDNVIPMRRRSVG